MKRLQLSETVLSCVYMGHIKRVLSVQMSVFLCFLTQVYRDRPAFFYDVLPVGCRARVHTRMCRGSDKVVATGPTDT